MADKTQPNTALWQQAIAGIAQSQMRFGKSEKDSEAEARTLRARYIERANAALIMFLMSDEGKIAKELLRVTKKRIWIASYGQQVAYVNRNNETFLYLCGDGLMYTSTVGDNVTTISAHSEHLVQSSNPFKIVSGYDDLHRLIEKIRAALDLVAEEHLPRTIPPSPKPG